MEDIGRGEQEPTANSIVEHTETGEALDLNDSRYELSEGVLRKGVYRHYKSTFESPRYYAVEMTVMDTKSNSYFVIYKPLDESEDAATYARPLDMFTDRVAIGKGKIPRFRYLGNNI